MFSTLFLHFKISKASKKFIHPLSTALVSAAVGVFVATVKFAAASTGDKQAFTLSPLPYAKNALEPHISAETVDFHYEKHHRGYVTKLNALAESDQKLRQKSLKEVILSESGKPFNLAAQIWNHTFYWDSMKPATQGSGKPEGKLLAAIEDSFGTYDKFRDEFNNKAINHFGSGWAWLVQDKKTKKLVVLETHDAGTPLTNLDYVPLLTCDVWEHSYYIDKRHDRTAYVNAWWNLVDWGKVAQRLN